jgi:dihydrofolate reductase
MRKIKLQMQITLDGFVGGANGELDWMVAEWDDVLKLYAMDLTNSADTFLLGRATGEGMAIYWPTVASNPESKKEDLWMAEKLNNLPKVVFSKTLTCIRWTNTRVANDIVEEVRELKKEPGGDIIIYGGAGIVSSFIRENLIDEYHLFVNPVAIGKGLTIFGNTRHQLNLKLVNTIVSTSGIVVLQYVPEQKQTESLLQNKLYETSN